MIDRRTPTGAVLAPVLAAVGALVALLKDCTIHVERTDTAAQGGGAADGPSARGQEFV